MAEVQSDKTPTLAEQYALKEKEEEKLDLSKPSEVKEVENSESPAPVEGVSAITDEPPVDADVSQSSDNAPAAKVNGVASVAAAGEGSETNPSTGAGSETNPAAENDSETANEESGGKAEEENSDGQESNEEPPEIKLETAPVDFRFPTTNQSRHCFTRYIEYHRCIAAKGDGAPECDKFAKYYRSLCPGEWIDKWNEQRENGSFPGPL